MEAINKVQINFSTDVDVRGNVTKKSLLINIRCDEVEESVCLFESLQQRLSSNVFGVKPEITYESLFEDPKPRALTSPACPRCGKPLKERKGATSNFLGCSGYPICKHTQAI